MAIPTTLVTVLLFALAMAAGVLLLIFVLVPIFRGIGWLVFNLFRAIGWIVVHLFEFIAGMIGDSLRFVGALIATVVLVPMSLLNVVIGRWSAAGHFAESVRRECKVAVACLYRVALRRPLKLLMLHGLLEGVEQRVPEAMAAAPTSDRPRKRVGQFDGYTIVGSLPGGGSGAKLFIAEPGDAVRQRYPQMPERVVIKCFALSEGSSLPQILRESRALECAKQLGLVFEHSIDEHRFFYVMPYHAGDHLGVVTRQLHGESGEQGLGPRQLAQALGYVGDLVESLATYHRGGLWHKDVKPDNVIVHSGRAHLVDLGLVTPLRSAMTLTTHGTEYFRDPEMVRQALRGVKVHQINGAKFDIFAVGAVLYFMTENTFPAHGALSRFQRRSPDALRWIIRRAMADYSHRYETADEMLADLRHVASAADPHAVKPADLPSLRGVVAAAEPPALPEDESFMPAPAPMQQHAAAAMPAVATPPVITVTNWWTGAYRVDDAAVKAGTPVKATPAPPQYGSEVFREQARALRHETAQLRREVRDGRLTVRKAAREQVRAARARAHEVRRRTRSHGRHRAVAERQPSGTLIALGIIALLVMFGAVTIAVKKQRTEQRSVFVTVTKDTGAPLLIVDTEPSPDDARQAWLDGLAARYTRDGYNVIPNRSDASERLHAVIAAWQATKGVDKDAHRIADRALEDWLETLNLYGFLFVKEQAGELKADFIYSVAEDAELRRHTVVVGSPPSDRPYLLINDHPTRHAMETQLDLSHRIGEYQLRGWNIVSDSDLEADIRKLLPTNPGGSVDMLPARLFAALDEAGFGGILYVTSGRDSDAAAGHVEIHVIHGERAVVPAPVEEASGRLMTELARRAA